MAHVAVASRGHLRDRAGLVDEIEVFLSRPTTLTEAQEEFGAGIAARLQRAKLRPRTVGVDTFGNSVPLATVRILMSRCHGAVILGFHQHHVLSGMRKVGTNASRPSDDEYLPTPWNQIEAGMAFAMRLPLMIIRESRLAGEGIFDIGSSDVFVHTADVDSAWLDEPAFEQPFSQWVAEVRSHSHGV